MALLPCFVFIETEVTKYDLSRELLSMDDST